MQSKTDWGERSVRDPRTNRNRLSTRNNKFKEAMQRWQ